MMTFPIAKMTWQNAMFVHWEVKSEQLQNHLPPRITLDLYNGKAYIGIVLLYMNKIELTFLPFITRLSFPQINVRTYVEVKGEKGVYFFNLNADSHIAVLGGKLGFKSPYNYAKITFIKENNEFKVKQSDQLGQQIFSSSFKPIGKSFHARKNSLEHWLTERYRFFTYHNGEIYFGDIIHNPWKLQEGILNIKENHLLLNNSLPKPFGEPYVLYSESQFVKGYPLKKLVN